MKINEFHDFCKNRKIAIVGNGALDGVGPEIDDHDVVFRFNNYILNEKNSRNCGKKTDCWVHSFCRDIEPRTDMFKFQVCPIPLEYMGGKNFFNNSEFRDLNESPLVVSTSDIFSKILRYIRRPSTGISFLFFMRELELIENCNMFGFDFFEKPNYFRKKKIVNTHNGLLERDFFMSVILKSEVKI